MYYHIMSYIFIPNSIKTFIFKLPEMVCYFDSSSFLNEIVISVRLSFLCRVSCEVLRGSTSHSMNNVIFLYSRIPS